MADAPLNTPIRSLFFNLGSVERIPLGQGRCFVVGGEEVAVFRQRDGRVFATQNRCPHRQGPLSEGIIGDGKVLCPLHAHKYDLCTGQGENQECVRTYPVRLSRGQIILGIPSKEKSSPLLAAVSATGS